MEFININPAPWATDATFPAGSNPWSGGPTRINPGPAVLAAGAAPGAQPAAQVTNYQLGTVGESLDQHSRVLAHAALTQWDAISIPSVGSDVYESLVGMRIARGYGITSDTQRELIAVGRDSAASNKARLAHSGDGSKSESTPPRLDTIASFTSPVFAAAGAPGELILFNNNNLLAYSTDSTNTWSASTISLSGPPKVQAVHYVPSGTAVGYHAVITNASAFYIRANSISNLLASPTTGAIPTAGGLAFDDNEVEFASNSDGSIIMIAGATTAGVTGVYRSTDGGANWALVSSPGGAHVNIAYSEHHGAFFTWSSNGTVRSSGDGSAWSVLSAGVATTGNGFLVGRGTLLAVGPALVKPANYTSAYGILSGIAYSLDQAASWNYHYFMTATATSLVTSCLRAMNGRVYATGLGTIWRSGILGAPAGEI